MPTTKRGAAAAPKRKRVAKAAAPTPSLNPSSPLAVFRANVPREFPATLTREALLAVESCDVIGEHGIHFDGTQWWSDELRPFVSLPPADRKRPLAGEIRWDQAARTRGQLTCITYMLRDELGRVVKTIVCGLRSIAQVTVNREKDRAAKDEYEQRLKARRTDIQVRATKRFAGGKAAQDHADLLLSPTHTSGEPDSATEALAPAPRGSAASKSSSRPRARGRPRKDGAATAATAVPATSGSGRSAPARRTFPVPPPPVVPQPDRVPRGASFAALAHSLAGDKRPARRRS